ncbi:MAG: hypothetical protein WCW14_01985 [Candidatus Paceibacterota bacterium]|jgi:hypothetical protein
MKDKNESGDVPVMEAGVTLDSNQNGRSDQTEKSKKWPTVIIFADFWPQKPVVVSGQVS